MYFHLGNYYQSSAGVSYSMSLTERIPCNCLFSKRLHERTCVDVMVLVMSDFVLCNLVSSCTKLCSLKVLINKILSLATYVRPRVIHMTQIKGYDRTALEPHRV